MHGVSPQKYMWPTITIIIIINNNNNHTDNGVKSNSGAKNDSYAILLTACTTLICNTTKPKLKFLSGLKIASHERESANTNGCILCAHCPRLRKDPCSTAKPKPKFLSDLKQPHAKEKVQTPTAAFCVHVALGCAKTHVVLQNRNQNSFPI